MSRPLEDWADRKYRAQGHLAHVFPFGSLAPLCGMEATSAEWLGTGTFDEIEHAAALPLCGRCETDLGPDPAVTIWENALNESGHDLGGLL